MTPYDLPDGNEGTVEISGQEIRFTSLSKVVVPAAGGCEAWTKRDTLSYYLCVSDRILEQTSGRCTTMVRYPKGPERPLYLKSAPPAVPPWVTMAPGPAGGDGGMLPYIVVDSLATLVWTVNFGVFEFHAPMSAVDRPDVPTHLVFDLDPGPGTGIRECCAVALHLLELESEGLSASDVRLRTSGSKGLHMLLPNAEGWTTDRALSWSEDVAREAASALPGMVTAEKRRSARDGRVLVDWQQNQQQRTTAVAWSLRLSSGLGVATPVSLGEVRECAEGRQTLRFMPGEALKRTE